MSVNLLVSRTALVTHKGVLFGATVVLAVSLISGIWLATAAGDDMPPSNNSYMMYSSSYQSSQPQYSQPQSYPMRPSRSYPPVMHAEDQDNQDDEDNDQNRHPDRDNDRYNKQHHQEDRNNYSDNNYRSRQDYSPRPMMMYQQSPKMQRQPDGTASSMYQSPAYTAPTPAAAYAAPVAPPTPVYPTNTVPTSAYPSASNAASYKLVNAGPGSPALLFILGTIGGTLAYRQLLLRRLSSKHQQ